MANLSITGSLSSIKAPSGVFARCFDRQMKQSAEKGYSFNHNGAPKAKLTTKERRKLDGGGSGSSKQDEVKETVKLNLKEMEEFFT